MYLQSHIYKNITVSFDFITTWNQGVFLCSPCIWNLYNYSDTVCSHNGGEEFYCFMASDVVWIGEYLLT